MAFKTWRRRCSIPAVRSWCCRTAIAHRGPERSVRSSWHGTVPERLPALWPTPILGQVQLVTITNEKAIPQESPPLEVVSHLAAHGIRVTCDAVDADGCDAATAIVEDLQEHSGTLLVMGGYGQSRQAHADASAGAGTDVALDWTNELGVRGVSGLCSRRRGKSSTPTGPARRLGEACLPTRSLGRASAI
jgi:hypothetical protein